jgi:hypothetical protein
MVGWKSISAAVTAAVVVAAGGLLAASPGYAQTAYAGYLFVYFTGEGTANGEQVYFALSRGNNPLSFQQLNGGQPVLSSTVGTTGVRDPFIIRSPAGDRFFLIATDLKIFGNGNWDAAQRQGSKSIVVWESTDLVSWGSPRLVGVSPDTAGNTWAPEAFYDTSLGRFVVFWASKIYAVSDPNHTGNTHNRMMYATTQDFRSFSAAQVWYDPGYSVIDSTVITVGSTYYRYTKDERGGTACGQFITSHTSTNLLSTNWALQRECVGQGSLSRGEGPLVFKSNTENRWYLFIDEFGGRGYVPFESTNLADGQWIPSAGYSLPASPRHGTVLPVTQAEYDRLLQAYGGGADGSAVTLTARHSGKCADVVSQSTADGAEVAQYACNGGANQRWQLRGVGGGYVQLVAQHSGKCLDVAGGSTADGARVLQWACHSGTNQQWQLQDAGSGYVRLMARHSGKCLDVTGSATTDGARLSQWSCNGGSNQQWQQNPA